ncbi:MAG: nucleotidyltransferase domain-containing protein [Clostridia bacterium]|nr:nucleotidyltransferase domain-containing protein [Clostridia bacterium]
MTYLDRRNRKIIDAIIEKAAAVCPGSLALIAVGGSFATGDIHEKSDLDLLILINDERGYQLAHTFIQDDLGVGHDLYCTTWDSLREDAQYPHPHIAKLMDSIVVWHADEKYLSELEALRARARTVLTSPLSEADYEKAASQLRMAEGCLTDALTADNHSDILNAAGGVIYYTENAVALLNKRYFRKSVRRAYDELNAMPLRPANLTGLIESVVSAESDEALKGTSLLLIREIRRCFHEVRRMFARAKSEPDADVLRGTYEEMFSNWRNKMFLAAQENNRHLAFMSMISMNAMLSDISEEMETGGIDVLGGYDPNDLMKTAQSFDEALSHYRRLYEQAALTENRYPDIDAFIETYRQ